MANIFGVADTDALQLYSLLKATAHLMGHLAGARRPSSDETLTPARMRLLIRLVVDERLGEGSGLTPSELSRYSGVSRNTISALLNSLEEHALIERHLDPSDRRQFRIRITQAGKEVVARHAPGFGAFVTDLLAPLSTEERATLRALLEKLFAHIVEMAAQMDVHVPDKGSVAPADDLSEE